MIQEVERTRDTRRSPERGQFAIRSDVLLSALHPVRLTYRSRPGFCRKYRQGGRRHSGRFPDVVDLAVLDALNGGPMVARHGLFPLQRLMHRLHQLIIQFERAG